MKDSEIDVEIANSINSSISTCVRELNTSTLRIDSLSSVNYYTIYTESQIVQMFNHDILLLLLNNTGNSTVHSSMIRSMPRDILSYEYTYTFSQYPLLNDPYLSTSTDTLNRTYAIALEMPTENEYIAPSQIPKVDRRISNIIIDEAIRREEVCSISLDPIRKETATCVSPCYHCFDRESIEQWLLHSDKCPQCRVKCVI